MIASVLVSMNVTADRSSTIPLLARRALVSSSSSLLLETMSRSPSTVMTASSPRRSDEICSSSTRLLRPARCALSAHGTADAVFPGHPAIRRVAGTFRGVEDYPAEDGKMPARTAELTRSVTAPLRMHMAVTDNRASWWALAACQSADPELFFPVSEHGRGAEQARRAKLVCAACPVRRPCLDYALGAAGLHGVWGGTTETERQVIRRRSARVRGPVAGAVPSPAR